MMTGIHHQGQQASEVAGGVEEIRVFRGRMIGVGEPALEDRRGRRQREKRQPDRFREDEEQPANRVAVGRRLGVRTDGERQRHEREQRARHRRRRRSDRDPSHVVTPCA